MKKVLRAIPILVAIFFIFYVAGAAMNALTSTVAVYWAFLAVFVPLFLVFLGFIAIFTRRNFAQIAKFEVQPIGQDAVSEQFRARVVELEALGFRTLGPEVALVSQVPLRLQAFIAPDGRGYASVFEHGSKPEVAFDFDAWLEDGRLLTTSSSNLAARTPVRPTLVIQVFTEGSAAELWKRHQEALAVVGSAPKPLGAGAEDYIDACRENYRRQFEGFGVGEFLRMLVPGKSPHSVPIASRPR
jgi:hypothetical protein